jgi:hypothetical protein
LAKEGEIMEEFSGRVLILRTCNADLTSYGGFVWREAGSVEAPDWDPEPECGNGLHGWLWGEGDGDLGKWEPDARWLVVSVEKSTIVDLDGKVKFPRSEVVFCGDRADATAYLAANGGAGKAIIAGTATAGDGGTATAGDAGTATAGDAGMATAGDAGTATAGSRGTATAGDAGTATAGDAGMATAGYGGTATAGEDGTIAVEWYDRARGRYRKAIGVIGEDGLLPDVRYRLHGGKWEPVPSEGDE